MLYVLKCLLVYSIFIVIPIIIFIKLIIEYVIIGTIEMIKEIKEKNNKTIDNVIYYDFRRGA